MAMKKRPQGKFVAGKVEAPRKITIRGETHYLVYVTPEEAKDLKKAGGSGEAGPKGIPAFRKGGGRSDRGRSSSKDKVDKATDKDKVDKATDAKSSDKSTGGSNKSGGPTGGRGSEKSTPAPRDRDDRQPTPAPKSTPKPAPGDRDDRQPAPAPKSTPKPAPGDRDDRQPTPTPTPKPAPVVPSGQTQAQSAMNQYGSRANDPQTVSEILMAQQSLRSLTPPPPIQSMTQIAELGPAIPGAVTTDAGQQPYSISSLAKTQPPLSDLEFDEDYQDAKSQLEAAGYVVDENSIVSTTTGKSVGPLSEVVNFGRANPGSGGPAGFATAAPGTVVAPKVTDPKKDTGVAAVKKDVPFKGTMEDGVLLDRLGNPVVTNAKGYGYLDPLTGLAVTPWTDSINGGGPGYGGAALGSGGGAALDTNKDNYISEAEIAAGKAKGLELEQNGWSKFGTGLGITPLGSGIDPTGLAGAVDSGILGFARKLGAPAYVRPDSSIASGQKLNKWWEADKNALGFAYGTQDEISQRRADAVRAAAVPSGKRDSDRNDNGPVAPTVPTVTTPPTYTENASSPFAPIPNPNYNPADPMSLAYFTNPSYEELLAYRNSGTTPARPFAKGGIANLVKDGGNEKTIISDAIRAVEGKMSERDAAISLAKFVKAHGEPALRDLVDKVSSGEYADTRERFANGENGMVRGPGNGSGTDDKVPATIDGEQDVLLADGEMVLRKKTTDAIEKAYPGLLDRINAAEGDAPKVLAKALDFIEGRNRRG
jgi:hypothetical protein